MKCHPFGERVYFFAEMDNKEDKSKIELISILIFQGITSENQYLINPCYFINPLALVANILTAIANKITPKNFLVIIIPFGPNTFSIHFSDFKTK